MNEFVRDGIRFYYRSEGSGPTVVWQHGLGSNIDLTFEPLALGFDRELAGFRFLGFDTRAHGRTAPMGPSEKIGIPHSAEDLLALLDHLEIDQAIVGGVSMGAAIALNIAIRYPERARGLVLCRPAWLDRPFPENLALFGRIASHLRELGPKQGLAAFRQTREFQALENESPDCAQVVVNHFQEPHALEFVERLERIPAGAPTLDRADWTRIEVPCLVLGNEADPIHPLEYAHAMAQAIPGAEFRSLTSKSVDVAKHAADLRASLSAFLRTHYFKVA